MHSNMAVDCTVPAVFLAKRGSFVLRPSERFCVADGKYPLAKRGASVERS